MPFQTVATSSAAAFPGVNIQSNDSGDNYLSRISGETTLQIPPGRAVMQGTSDNLAVSLTSAANVRKFLGVLIYTPFRAPGIEQGIVADSNGNLGIMPGGELRIKYRGDVYVQITEDVDPTLGVRVSIDSTGGGIGTFRASASAGHTIDLSKLAVWRGTFTAAGGFAWLSFDARLIGLATAD